jgi:polysaccharide chain length determinant protein (PEP-CTERM system associated)
MNTDMFANGLNLNVIFDMFRRRLWIILPICILVLTTIVSLVIFLPNVYQASAVIIVEGQQIPTNYVQSTVTTAVERRLQMISQEILGRSRLSGLANQLGLYEDLKKKGASDEAIASAMRKDVSVEIKGKSGGDAVAFSVSYTSPDPEKAMQVANVLASDYIEGNFKIREDQAQATSQFLRSELERVKKQLEEQEQQVKEYKERYLLELPSQLDANMSALSILEKKMEGLSSALSQARERRNLLARMAQQEAEEKAKKSEDKEDLANVPLSVLTDRLAMLRTRFSDKHPDVVSLKALIETIERQQKTPLGDTLPKDATGYSAESALIDAEIQRLSAELGKVQQEIAVYQKRLEGAPQREIEMQTITRNYETTQVMYESLLKRLQEANLADSLEQRQKAERFRLVEPAVVPTEPAAPKRMKLLAVGLLLSGGGAVGLALLREFFDTSFHNVDALRAFCKFPVLVSIPQVVTEADRSRNRRQQYLGVVALVVSVFLVIGASYWIAAGNEPLVRSLVSPSGGIQFR